MQERIGDELPRHERWRRSARADGPQRERPDETGDDRLQQEQRDVGDDQCGGDGWHGASTVSAAPADAMPDKWGQWTAWTSMGPARRDRCVRRGIKCTKESDL